MASAADRPRRRIGLGLGRTLARAGHWLRRWLIGGSPRPDDHAPGMSSDLPVWPPSWLMRHRLIRYRRLIARTAQPLISATARTPVAGSPSVAASPVSRLGLVPMRLGRDVVAHVVRNELGLQSWRLASRRSTPSPRPGFFAHLRKQAGRVTRSSGFPARLHEEAAAAGPTKAEAAWRASVAEHPLETPRPLTGRWAVIARQITGRRETRYTTGPATRRALHAAGARGATTGSVLHLAATPTDHPADAAVVGHELGHSRTPVLRPRFLLSSPAGHDEEERSAERVASNLLSRSPTSAPAATGVRPAAGPIGATVLRKTEAGLSPAVASTAPLAPRSVLGRSVAVVSRIPSTSGSARSGLAAADRYLPGLVDTLPVTSVGGLLDAARTVTTEVSSAAENTPGNVAGLMAAAGLPAAATPGLPNLPSGLELPGVGLPFEAPGSGGATTMAGAAASGSAAGGSGTGMPGTGAASGVPGPQSALPADFDRLLEALEDSVLRDIERRGGRFEGVF